MQVLMPLAPALAVNEQVRRDPSIDASPRLFRPGWPLAWLFLGFPLWWALGLGDFAFLIFAVPMALDLIRKRQVETPRAFGTWLLFLAWVLFGVLTLQVNAPGTVAGESDSRYGTWAYRLGWYLAVTVVMLYVLNNRKALPSLRVARILSWMFVWITLGGLAGVVAHEVEFRSLLEIVLPSGIADSGFVNSLIHPSFAQIQDVLGYTSPRPSAPFAYANTWGVNFACFLPFFVYAWCSRGSGWRRVAGPVVLAMATIPVIYSLNRGLWVALAAMALFVVIRAGFTGRPALLVSVLAGGLFMALLLSISPLGNVVSDRLEAPRGNSNLGRQNLSSLAVRSVADKSPVVGLGSTRAVQGGFNSIGAGRTEACPKCSPPALGTQGQMWLVVVSQGLLGLFFYLLFFGRQLIHHIRRRGPTVMMGLSVVLVGFVTMPVYNSIGPALLAIMVAVGLMTADASSDPLARAPRRGLLRKPATIGGYVDVLRQNAAIVVVCIVAGALVASTWQAVQGTRTVATVAVMVPQEAPNPVPASPPLTMDSNAQLIRFPAVINAMSAATGHRLSSDDPDLTVTATPNARVLHITYTADSAAVAAGAVTAGASAFIALNAQEAEQRRALQLEKLGARASSLSSAITSQSTLLQRLQAPSVNYLNDLQVTTLRESTSALIVKAGAVAIQIDRVTSRQPTPALIVAPTSTSAESDVWKVSIATGLSLGLLLGVLLAWLRQHRGPRLRRTSDVPRWTDLPVLAVVPSAEGSRGRTADMDSAFRSLDRYRPTAFVSASANSRTGVSMAGELDERLWRHGFSSGPASTEHHRSQRVVLVVPQGTRARELALVHDRLSQTGSVVAGVIFNSRASNRPVN